MTGLRERPPVKKIAVVNAIASSPDGALSKEEIVKLTGLRNLGFRPLIKSGIVEWERNAQGIATWRFVLGPKGKELLLLSRNNKENAPPKTEPVLKNAAGTGKASQNQSRGLAILVDYDNLDIQARRHGISVNSSFLKTLFGEKAAEYCLDFDGAQKFIFLTTKSRATSIRILSLIKEFDDAGWCVVISNGEIAQSADTRLNAVAELVAGARNIGTVFFASQDTDFASALEKLAAENKRVVQFSVDRALPPTGKSVHEIVRIASKTEREEYRQTVDTVLGMYASGTEIPSDKKRVGKLLPIVAVILKIETATAKRKGFRQLISVINQTIPREMGYATSEYKIILDAFLDSGILRREPSPQKEKRLEAEGRRCYRWYVFETRHPIAEKLITAARF